MDERQRRELIEIMGETVQLDCAMSEHTTFRIGGKADAVCFVQKLGELQELFSYINKENIPYLVVGGGSNLLVRDGGFKGVVIIMREHLASIKKNEKNEQIFNIDPRIIQKKDINTKKYKLLEIGYLIQPSFPMKIFSPTSKVEFSPPRISSRVSLSSPIAVTIIPSRPRTVNDFPLGLKSRTYAYSSYFLGGVFTRCK